MDDDALMSGSLIDALFVGVDTFEPLLNGLGVIVLFADPIPYVLTGTIVVVVVMFVVVVDDFGLGACFFLSSSSLLRL